MEGPDELQSRGIHSLMANMAIEKGRNIIPDILYTTATARHRHLDCLGVPCRINGVSIQDDLLGLLPT